MRKPLIQVRGSFIFWGKKAVAIHNGINRLVCWCGLAFPNEDWIHPQSLTVVGYAALQPVSMEILCCSVHPPPPPSSVHFYQTGLLYERDLGQAMHVCVYVR